MPIERGFIPFYLNSLSLFETYVLVLYTKYIAKEGGILVDRMESFGKTK